MADSGKVTLRQVYDSVVEVKEQLKKINGTVAQHCVDIARLQEKNAQHEKESEKTEKINDGRWNRVLDLVVKPIAMALIAALMGLVIYGQIKP